MFVYVCMYVLCVHQTCLITVCCGTVGFDMIWITYRLYRHSIQTHAYIHQPEPRMSIHCVYSSKPEPTTRLGKWSETRNTYH